MLVLASALGSFFVWMFAVGSSTAVPSRLVAADADELFGDLALALVDLGLLGASLATEEDDMLNLHHHPTDFANIR